MTKSIEYYLPGINFRITMVEKYLNTVKPIIDNTICIQNKDSMNWVNIGYIVDEKAFNEVIEKIKNEPEKTYNNYENQVHKEYVMDDLLYYIELNNEYICIKKDEKDYRIIVKNNNNISANWINRLIREIYLREKENHKYNFMHANGVEINGNGILIIGNDGSGKTTLTIKFIEQFENLKFLSNDRVLINKSLEMDYFPQATTLKIGTIKNSYNLDKYFKENKILEKRKNIIYSNASVKDKCNISLNEIIKIFPKIELVSKTHIDLIIIPKFDMQCNEQIIINLSEEEKKNILLENDFTPYDKETLRSPWIKKRIYSDEELIKNREIILNELINKVPIVQLIYGPNTNLGNLLKMIGELYEEV